MFSFFRQSFRQWARSGTKPSGATKPAPRRLQCESLEDRIMPSLAGTDILVNTTKTGVQHQAVSAMSSNGSAVVVWTEVKTSIDRDIKAQRFDSAGNKVGGEILVAGGRNPQHAPVVSMDAKGNFAVAWIHDFSTTDRDIHAAQFKADGTKVGSEITVANSPRGEFDPSIAMASGGGFVITYTYQYNSTDTDIKGVLFKADGTVSRTFDAAVSSRNESRSSVSMAPDGRFAVAFVKSDDVYVQRYAADGKLVSTQLAAGGTTKQGEPRTAMDTSGNVLVVWQQADGSNWNVYSRSVSSTGVLGSVKTIQATTAQETLPSVAVDSSTGKFVVAFQSVASTGTSVKVTELSATGSIIRTSTFGSGLADPTVSLGGSAHRFLVVAQSLGKRGLDPDGGIFARFGTL